MLSQRQQEELSMIFHRKRRKTTPSPSTAVEESMVAVQQKAREYAEAGAPPKIGIQQEGRGHD